MRKEPFLYAAAFAMDGSIGITGLCVPLLAMRLGGTYDDLGFIGSAGSVTYTLGCLVSGRLADRVGYRRSMAVAAIAVAALMSLYPFATHVGHLTLLTGGIWLVMSGYWPALQAWLGRGKDPRSLLLALGGFNMAWALGILIGPPLGGVLYAQAVGRPFAIGAGLVGALFLSLLFLRVRETASAGAAADAGQATGSRAFLWVAWTANFATFFATGTVRSLFPKFASDLGIAPEPLGRLMALIGLSQVAVFYIVSRTDRWQFRFAPLAAAQFLGIAGLTSVAVGTTSAVFAIGLFALGALTGMTFTASIFYSLFSGGPGGRRTGLHEAIVGSGFLFGPLAGGIAAEYLGPRAPYLISAAVILCAIAFEAFLLKKIPARAWIAQAGD